MFLTAYSRDVLAEPGKGLVLVASLRAALLGKPIPDSTTGQAQLARNVEVHDRLALKYDAKHPEIFNGVEQARLFSALERAWMPYGRGLSPQERWTSVVVRGI